MAKTFDELPTYKEVVEHFQQEHREMNLLLGNGFSIAYDKDIFSYNALSRYIMDSDDEVIKRVFGVYNTQNFETIMQQLRNMVDVLKILDAPQALCSKVAGVSQELKAELIDAINEAGRHGHRGGPDQKLVSVNTINKNFYAKSDKSQISRQELTMVFVVAPIARSMPTV